MRSLHPPMPKFRTFLFQCSEPNMQVLHLYRPVTPFAMPRNRRSNVLPFFSSITIVVERLHCFLDSSLQELHARLDGGLREPYVRQSIWAA